jgi:uncharacterized small protein (DUF1192 family)
MNECNVHRPCAELAQLQKAIEELEAEEAALQATRDALKQVCGRCC